MPNHSLFDDGPRDDSVVMLTTFDHDEYVYDALRAGASGFLLKDAPRGQLLHAVRTVATGGEILAPAITRRLIEHFVDRRSAGAGPPPQLEELSEREVQVLTLLARGLSKTEIAADLVISRATVKTHVARVLQKLGLRDRIQAVVLAYETGLIHPGAETASSE